MGKLLIENFAFKQSKQYFGSSRPWAQRSYGGGGKSMKLKRTRGKENSKREG